MKFRTTLILMVVLAAVIAFIAFYESERPGTDEAKRKATEVFHFRSEDVTSLSVITGSTEISVRKTGDREWALEKPVAWRADTGTIDRILSELEFLRCDSRLTVPEGETVDLESYGLDSPEISISFSERGREYRLALSSRRGIDGKVYAQAGETGEVLLLAPSAMSPAKVSPNEFRDKTVLEFDTDKAFRLEIERKAGNLFCELDGEQWYITEPSRFRAGKVQVESLINQLAALKVKDWIDDAPEDLSKYGLDSPAVVAKLDVGREEKPALLLGTTVPDDSEKRYAKIANSSLVFTVRDTIAPELEKPYSEIRDHTLIHVRPDQLSGISISTDSSVISLRSEGAAENRYWGLKDPVDIQADSDEVRDYVDRLSRLEVDAFVSDSEENLTTYGLVEAGSGLSLEFREGEEQEKRIEVFIGKEAPEGDLVYAKRSDEPSVYSIGASSLSWLFPSYLKFRTKKLLSFRSADAARLTLHRDDGTYVCESEGVSKWRLRKPFEISTNAANVRTIVNNLAGLKAERFISDSQIDWGQYGLLEPELTVVVEFKDEAAGEGQERAREPVELRIGSQFEEEDLHYARLADKPLLFLVSQGLVDKLRADVIDRVVVDFLTSEILDLRIAYPSEGLKIVIEKQGTKWKMLEPEKADVDIVKLAGVTSKLSRLKCKMFLEELETEPEGLGLDTPVYQVVVNLGSKKITLKLGAQTPEGDYYADASSISLPFVLSKNVAQSLMKKPSDLRK